MLGKERTAVASLAAIMAFRMLGLFMILPVFSVYASQLSGSTATLIGLALGIYGLTQAMLQIPFGMLSDRIGRKPILVVGLLIFAAGSIVAASSHSIYGVIIGRAIQGAGAVGSTLLALVADLTRDENRSKAMATIGLAIGLAFSLALILGPIINSWFHLAGIFWTTAGFAFISIILVVAVLPTSPKLITHQNAGMQPNKLKASLKNPQLLRLNLGICCLHAMLTALFIAIPILLTRSMHLTEMQQVSLYLIVIVLSFACMVPLIIIAEKKHLMKPFFLGSIAVLVFTLLFLITAQHSVIATGALLLIFFTAFTLLEANLPSLVSKFAPIRAKGTAMGVYSSCQFLGIFIGGILGGWIFAHTNLTGIYVLCAFIGMFWFVHASTMKQPPHLSTMVFKLEQTVKENLQDFATILSQKSGVAEVVMQLEEGLAYLKVDKKKIDKHELRKLFETGTLPE